MEVRKGERSTGPLAGIRVVDLSNVVSGPLCTQILGDLGADVIKVEALSGDLSRRLGPPFVDGLTPLYAHCNRNKRAIALDLKSPQAVEVVRRLARDADVLLENYRPDVAARLGLGWDDLSRENPKLIYVSLNGFGDHGPYRDLPAYDNVIQGLVGFAKVQGGKQGPPSLVKNLVADKSSALTAVYAVLAGLLARERSDGRGQRIEVPMLDAFAAFMLVDVLRDQTFPEAPTFALPDLDPHRAWETSDGHVVMMIIEDHQFQAMCRAIGRDDLIDDPRCANLIQRVLHAEELFRLTAEECKKWTTAELVERARRFGAPVAPCNGLEDFLADPQVAANGTVFETPDRTGPMRLLKSPVRFERTPTDLRHTPPRIGEHTDEILRESGYTVEEFATLRSRGCAA
jgi:crotonobetainyl-CoA:carnitine CoA-transferase CaiB-like acyl-CoA transferase